MVTEDMVSDAGLVERARAWAAGDPDPATRSELEELVTKGALEELRQRMGPELDFGTAGLRGRVGAGPARMNRAVVTRATRAFAEHLLARVPDARALPVIVGYDARPSSRELADVAIGVLLAAGLGVRAFEGPVPTPLVAYAARVFSAAGALVVTASHNPREDNGLKVYGPDATQLVTPADADVAQRRDALGPASSIPRGDGARAGSLEGRLGTIPEALFDRYLAEVAAHLPPIAAERRLKIAYTPLHGLGWAPIQRALRSRGFLDVAVVAEQAEPDGAFPTAPSPNPELPATLERVLALAAESGAELVLVNDPDVDRLACAAPLPSGRYHVFTGNEIAALLADFVLDHAQGSPVPLVVSSIVTSSLVARIAEKRGARSERSLTGFKWMWAAARALERQGVARPVFGCEEALGFSIFGTVRDKDGISAALWIAELAERCRRSGKTLLDRLHELYRQHGAWGSAQRSIQGEGSAALLALRERVERLVAEPPATLDGLPLEEVVDYRSKADQRPLWLGAADLYELRYGKVARVLVRPSGTEPKLKIYADVEDAVGASESATAAAERAGRRANALASAFAARVEAPAEALTSS